jgi:hypothetical protein
MGIFNDMRLTLIEPGYAGKICCVIIYPQGVYVWWATVSFLFRFGLLAPLFVLKKFVARYYHGDITMGTVVEKYQLVA